MVYGIKVWTDHSPLLSHPFSVVNCSRSSIYLDLPLVFFPSNFLFSSSKAFEATLLLKTCSPYVSKCLSHNVVCEMQTVFHFLSNITGYFVFPATSLT